MPLPDRPIEGGCRCVALRFRQTAPPLVTAARHGRGCQRATGSEPSLAVAGPDGGFAVIAGGDVAGGAGRACGHHACPLCLSRVRTRSARMRGFSDVRATMLDDPAGAWRFVETGASGTLPWADAGAARSYPGLPSMEEHGALPGVSADRARA